MFARLVVNHGINARKNKMTEEIKEKYKNGVTQEIIKEWLGK